MPTVAAITNDGVFWLIGLILIILLVVFILTPWLERHAK